MPTNLTAAMQLTRPQPLAVGITCGDPAGIGLEVCLKAAAQTGLADSCALIVYAAAAHLEREAALCGLSALPPAVCQAAREPGLWWEPLPGPATPPAWGCFQPAWGAVARDSLERTASAAADGTLDAVLTAPVCKRITAEFGDSFPGQTELYAHRSGGHHPVMMLAGPTLRVVPITIHVPLRLVPELLTYELLLGTLRTVHTALVGDLGLPAPRLAMVGLNPHAGEGGLLGHEEMEIIAPALAQARIEGIDVTGPHPADTFFHFAAQGACDAVLCPTHDQALIPLKLLHFDSAVNVTLGLPIVRTSPDHGTAYDLAGQGVASWRSASEALQLAVQIAGRRRVSRCNRARE